MPYSPTNEFLFGNTDEEAIEHGKPADMMAKAVRLIATEALDKVTGRVTYSQAIIKDFGCNEEVRGYGIDPNLRVTGYSQQ